MDQDFHMNWLICKISAKHVGLNILRLVCSMAGKGKYTTIFLPNHELLRKYAITIHQNKVEVFIKISATQMIYKSQHNITSRFRLNFVQCWWINVVKKSQWQSLWIMATSFEDSPINHDRSQVAPRHRKGRGHVWVAWAAHQDEVPVPSVS